MKQNKKGVTPIPYGLQQTPNLVFILPKLVYIWHRFYYCFNFFCVHFTPNWSFFCVYTARANTPQIVNLCSLFYRLDLTFVHRAQESIGDALIFNHIEYNNVNIEKRTATGKDVDNLKNAFARLGMNVTTYLDLQKQEIKNTLKERECDVISVIISGEYGKSSW